MVTIKELGEKYQVNYILFNRIEHINDRFILNGLLFNTRSGGLIYRRKIDLKQYLNGQINELNMWVGNTVGKVEKNW
jgi:TolB-like protein